MKISRILYVLVAMVLTGTAFAAEPPIAIIGALREEVRTLEAKLENKQTVSHLGMTFFSGSLHGRQVVLVQSGMGKVNSAAATTIMLDRFHPRAVIFSGIAGGIKTGLKPGDLVIGDRVIQHDYGTFTSEGLKTEPTENPATNQRNPLAFLPSPQLVELARQSVLGVKLDTFVKGRAPVAVVGTIVTGDSFVASPAKCADLLNRFEAAAVEMEGGAVAQLCFQQGCPFVVIRCVSDSADVMAESDIKRFCQSAADNSSRVVEAMIKAFPVDKK